MSSASDPGYVGQVFEERYRILRLIGEGGMGAVYEAEHVVVGRHVAVKLLHPDMARNAQIVTRFHNEARAAGSIGNEHIIEVLDFGKQPAPYLVMEYLDGRSLSQLLEQEGPLSPSRAAALLIQVLEALEAAHAKGIVHRDLKPENVFLVRKQDRDHVKLLDFGISKLQTTDPQSGHLTQTGTILGTPYYMSPEQALGAKDLDHLTDIYSAGVILYECLTGKLPFAAENYNMLLVKIISDPPPPPRSFRPDLPEALEQITLKAMAQDRPLRFPSARAFAEALQNFISGRQTGVLFVPASPSDTAARLAAARSRILAGGGAAPPSTGTNLAWDGTSTGSPAPRSKAVPVAIAVGGLAIAAVVAAFLFLRKGDDASAPTAPPPAADVAPATPTPPPPPAVQAVPVADDDRSADAMQLTVSAAPPEAKIEVDGFEKPGNPLHGRFRKDGEDHRVRVFAPGYQEWKQLVTFDGDKTLTVTLDPLPPAPAADAGAALPPPSDAATGTRPPVRPRRDATGTSVVAPPPPPPPPAVDAGAARRDGFREYDPTPTHRPVTPVEDNPYGTTTTPRPPSAS
ncbi:MAG: serine/threonine protein kinase [Deltaproteobacteria bacterium]|nr:serine/threonine protein kinase [Deltaproteobacteria bacterium]